jgi:anaerobic selenocysteine-containing dehydrogenase
MESQPTTDALYESMMAASRVPLEELKRHPHGKIFDAEPIYVAPADPDAQDRLDVGNADMLAELASIRNAKLDATENMKRPFRLISRRMPNVYNSSGRDIASLVRKRPFNPAFLNPEDLALIEAQPGDLVRIASDHGEILGIATAAPELRLGTLSMAHCFGGTPEDETDVRQTGSNTGRLIDNERDFDPHTGIPRMSAIPVSITPVADPG